MKTRIVGLACIALLYGGSSIATADPVVITSGLISTDFTDLNATLNSTAFSLALIGPVANHVKPRKSGPARW